MLKGKNCIKLIVLLLASTPQFATAAQQTAKMWSLLTLAGDYGKIVYSIEPQLRLIYNNNVFQQFLANSGIGYKIAPHYQIWLGQTFSADSQDAAPGSSDEYRLWQQLIWKHTLRSASVISRTRFEERKSFFFPDWAYRLRERILISKPLNENFSLVFNDEIFLNVNKVSWIITNRLDQNRAFFGLERRLTEKTYLGLGYINQYLSTPIVQFNHVLWLNWRIDLENNS